MKNIMSLNVIIKASSKEEFEKLFDAYQEFQKAYTIKGVPSGKIEVSSLIENIIQIYPADETYTITGIESGVKGEGRLIKGNLEFLLIELGAHRFDINYKNPNFKKR